ncbi:RCC1/BLIP-II protein [Gonapodya prolifera JEL478]|uniref:RCC1/BLIP-II protein n=1 Tax=Gonapodya prolifera (strain JEL478) TaxID=1344416 RepID=A0A139A8H7_GONPJ|nr:RCC1/BLIP-II protein [Gonapodya prolifera JEL478]|eukprot:KXS13111.1 RCC1/BLIP-II protein [Gonapodya prolifera JEL478]
MLWDALTRRDLDWLRALLRRSTTDPNAVDSLGRTALHVAVQTGDRDVTLALLESDRVNVNAVDAESGWTPLHMAFYSGRLLVAADLLKRKPDLTITDREGKTPIDLLLASYLRAPHQLGDGGESDALKEKDFDSDDESSPVSSGLLPHSTAVFVWGSNANHTLGVPGDKAYPERVELAAKSKVSLETLSQHQPIVNQVVMGKFHTVFLTSEGAYGCGYGLGGRLGLGDQETRLEPKIIPLPFTAFSVSTGPDHTIFVSKRGEVFTCGSNEHGQLGYPVESAGSEVPHAKDLREVTALKKIVVLGAAAGKFHSAVYTSTGAVYTWGLNTGQLGYPIPPNAVSEISETPRKVPSLTSGQTILQIAATNNATCVLLDSHDILVFCGFGVEKVIFPPPIPFNAKMKDGSKVFKFYRSAKVKDTSKIVKITANNFQFLALTEAGDVITWVPPDVQYAEDWRQKHFCPQKRPKRIWSRRNKHLKAVDVAIGLDSAVLLVTEAGNVFQGNPRKEIKSGGGVEGAFYKYTKVPGLQHIRSVAASSAGAFAAVRSDSRPMPNSIETASLKDALCGAFEHIVQRDVDEQDEFADVVFSVSGREVWAHRIVLACRSEFFKNLFSVLDDGVEGALDYLPADWNVCRADEPTEFESRGVVRITIENLHSQSLYAALEWFYTGVYKRIWDDGVYIAMNSSESKKKKKAGKSKQDASVILYNEWGMLAKLLRIRVESHATGQTSSTVLAKDWLAVRPTDDKTPYGDIVVLLSDSSMLCHQVVLTNRSPYFKALLSTGSTWMRRNDKNQVMVDLSHIRREVFQVIVDMLYSDQSVDLFRKVERDTITEWINFIVEVLAAATELLLEKLKDVCSYLLNMVLSVRNVTDLLEVSDMYDCALKPKCIEFFIDNLETIIPTPTGSVQGAKLSQRERKRAAMQSIPSSPGSSSPSSSKPAWAVIKPIQNQASVAPMPVTEKAKPVMIQPLQKSSSSGNGSVDKLVVREIFS